MPLSVDQQVRLFALLDECEFADVMAGVGQYCREQAEAAAEDKDDDSKVAWNEIADTFERFGEDNTVEGDESGPLGPETTINI